MSQIGKRDRAFTELWSWRQMNIIQKYWVTQ